MYNFLKLTCAHIHMLLCINIYMLLSICVPSCCWPGKVAAVKVCQLPDWNCWFDICTEVHCTMLLQTATIIFAWCKEIEDMYTRYSQQVLQMSFNQDATATTTTTTISIFESLSFSCSLFFLLLLFILFLW